MKTNQVMKKNSQFSRLMIDIMSIHTKEGGETHRDYQVHTAKIGKNRIPILVCLTINLML